MITDLGHGLHMRNYSRNLQLARGLIVGLAGGLLGTIVMDLFGLIALLLFGGPSTISFALIGDAAAAFVRRYGVQLAGGDPLGIALHYLIGLGLGAIVGLATARTPGLALKSKMHWAGLAILYVEAMSVPMLAAAAFALNMSTVQIVQYFSTSFTMHLIFGCVLGLVLSRRLFPPQSPATNR